MVEKIDCETNKSTLVSSEQKLSAFHLQFASVGVQWLVHGLLVLVVGGYKIWKVVWIPVGILTLINRTLPIQISSVVINFYFYTKWSFLFLINSICRETGDSDLKGCNAFLLFRTSSNSQINTLFKMSRVSRHTFWRSQLSLSLTH